jgi:C-7 ketoreductase
VSVSEGRVIVTGATRGIGRATAHAILERGGQVIAVGRNRDLLEELRRQDEARIRIVEADLAELEKLPSIADQAVDAFGSVDGLVNNAGMAVHERVGTIRRESLEGQLRLNLMAPLLLSQLIAEHLRARGGAIVNVSSTLSERVAAGTAAYAATKAALNAVTRALALELAPSVRVNAVLPGIVDTDMIRAPGPRAPGTPRVGKELETRVEAQLEALRSRHPIGRLGRPEDVATVIVGLLDHPWQTGSLVTIDGGLSVAEA